VNHAGKRQRPRAPFLPPHEGRLFCSQGFPTRGPPPPQTPSLFPSPGGGSERRSIAPQRGSGTRKTRGAILPFHGLKTRGYRTPVPCGTNNRPGLVFVDAAWLAGPRRPRGQQQRREPGTGYGEPGWNTDYVDKGLTAGTGNRQRGWNTDCVHNSLTPSRVWRGAAGDRVSWRRKAQPTPLSSTSLSLGSQP